MTGRIALIRHGQTEWSATGRHTSFTDIDLTPTGEQQAQLLPQVITELGLQPATVITSPRLRARRTAELAGLTVSRTDDDLAEWNYGDVEGINSTEYRRDHPDWSVFTHGAPGGESVAQVQDRADRMLVTARELTADGDVLLVGHGHFSRVLAARWVGLPVAAAALLLIDPGSVSLLADYHGAPAIGRLNVPSPIATGH